ncbi:MULTISPECIES: SHOCT domain-containing protein [unclassified Brevundimonas]|uniref:SHOCT domain-containing protein n=1 Tax=unclassified Brevundimonas TaxID=2622653 RepID=UPI0025C60B47|nr:MULTISPECIES: SHOCT domain-containing protein [unclassified Brevundimonas]
MTDSRLDRLERLNRLRESGALTQQEFEREKRLMDEPAQAPAAAPRSGGGSKVLLLGSIAALAVVTAGATIFVLNNRTPQVVREAPPQAAVIQTPAVPEPDETPPAPIENDRTSGVGYDDANDPVPPPSARERSMSSGPNLTGGFYNYRTRIRDGWQGAPNLAGNYVVIRWGCGTGCTTGVVGNKRTGELHWLELGGEDYPYLQLRFGVGGNNVLASWEEGPHLCARQMFSWDGRRMVPQEEPELRKTRGDNCSE